MSLQALLRWYAVTWHLRAKPVVWEHDTLYTFGEIFLTCPWSTDFYDFVTFLLDELRAQLWLERTNTRDLKGINNFLKFYVELEKLIEKLF